MNQNKIVFATYFENKEGIGLCKLLCKSIRKFSGALRTAPIVVYYHGFLNEEAEIYKKIFYELSVELREIKVPQEAFNFTLGSKPFIASKAEKEMTPKADILTFLDPNIILIREPKDIILQDSKNFAYRPVMHQNIGSLYGEEPDRFWKQLYDQE